MTTPDDASSDDTRFVVPVLPAGLLDKPLDYIVADHDRHRAVCAYLKRVARWGAIDRASALDIAEFLNEDFRLHLLDESVSLYPALCRRSPDDTEFVRSIRTMEEFHSRSNETLKTLVPELRGLGAGASARISSEFSAALLDYARSEDQSLAFENAVIMVIAGVRLKKNDIEAIRTEMKRRRGMAAP
jgi:hypothetical protein